MKSKEASTVYLMGVGGIAMGTLAAMLRKKGFRVVGSDQNLYPPMSTYLEKHDIPIFRGYRAENLKKSAADLVVIGNVIRKDNPEARFVLEQRLPYISMPEALARFFLPGRKSIVVAGTHGKSTTSALLAWLLASAGLDPSAFVGAFVKNWNNSYLLGNGKYLVVEGDEYDTAFFDKGPKFLHYNPHIAIITSIEYDHADIFPDFAAVLDAFRSLVKSLPPDGWLIVNGDDENCRALARQSNSRTLTFGRSPGCQWRLYKTDCNAGEVRFTVTASQAGQMEFVSKLPGKHNMMNSLAAIVVASTLGISIDEIRRGLSSFKGVTRRQDLIGEARGILVMDDFAHHPTAVSETIQALKDFYPSRRLIAVFEPRTNSSRRRVFQEHYAAAFDDADVVCIKEPPGLENIPKEERLDTPRLVGQIQRRKPAFFFEESGRLLSFLQSFCRHGDLVLCMSNGSFDGLPHKLLEAIRDGA